MSCVKRSPAVGLPVEIWGRVLDILDHDTLPVIAAVNFGFNELCSTKFLSGGGESTGSLTIESRWLPSLQRLLRIPSISRLSCTFEPDQPPGHLLRGLRILLDIVQRSKELTTLDIEFPPDAFRAEDHDADETQQNLHNAFYDVLRCMSAKSGRHDICCFDSAIFSDCKANALSRSFLEPRYEQERSGARTRVSSVGRGFHISSISSVRLVSHSSAAVVIALQATTSRLRLPRLNKQSSTETTLQYLTIPGLTEVTSEWDNVGSILKQFLNRHPTLERVTICPTSAKASHICEMVTSIHEAVLPALKKLHIKAWLNTTEAAKVNSFLATTFQSSAI
ncbi:hypothetical protein C8R47DRAFT_1216180 [Mycena vitilis]|nr:hypothetical protein C8R47DRAFT_1216180 [Mycena vitilis]